MEFDIVMLEYMLCKIKHCHTHKNSTSARAYMKKKAGAKQQTTRRAVKRKNLTSGSNSRAKKARTSGRCSCMCLAKMLLRAIKSTEHESYSQSVYSMYTATLMSIMSRNIIISYTLSI